MSTLDFNGLTQLLKGLSVSRPPVELTGATILSNPLDLCRSALAELITSLTECDVQDAYKSIQWPNNIFNGDLSITLPRLRPGCKPAELSTELVDKFPKDNALFDPPLPEGVHLRVFLKLETVSRLLVPYILDRKRYYGFDVSNHITNLASKEGDRKKVIVEFSSPNITSEFQGKHLRSTIIGAFIGRLYDSMGWDVTRINYLGDWGKPIALLRVGWSKYGSDEAYEADPVGHLLEVYHKIEEDFKPEQDASRQARDDVAKEGKDEGEAQVEIESRGIFAERNEAFKKLEDGEEDTVAFWKRVRDVNIENYTKFYERLGVRFDEYSGESQVTPEVMVEVEQMLKDKKISEESGGAWIVHMQTLGAKAGTAIIRDRSGSSTYLLRDLAAVLERSRKYSFDKMIYIVASDNSVHFTQLFKILEGLELKDLASKLQHVKFSEVSKMAAILGKGYKPQAILDKCEEAMASLSEIDGDKATLLGGADQTRESLATSALLVQELSTRSSSTHAFDPSTLASFKLGSGPDLQYWSTKLRVLLTNAPSTEELGEEDYQALAEEDQANLLRVLAQYPEVVNATYLSLEPSGILAYLVTLTELLSECLGEGEEDAAVTPGLAALYEATRIVLESSMKLLGLTPLADLPHERADTPVGD
ncbi:Nucleotidylyl transferase [Cucurbitaria berberidis CBS 394.84]|uniref:arginine--tRNA ligase n=1 Tax=Cucurbitaria berberidis CBS 394.84 TaxID=1168544 RepID=A0A9P4L8D8_9PLEO|nr:Nucleotidylyl transferase [Cucurbitaria berberidis CBS 394.84]KAF1845930.1 Nucleotidylyl transferase [Cucurbitaria berberidis CBS 394.84]